MYGNASMQMSHIHSKDRVKLPGAVYFCSNEDCSAIKFSVTISCFSKRRYSVACTQYTFTVI